MGKLALIGLGSNLGDRQAILDGAVERLYQMPGLVGLSVSSYHETKPVGGPAGQGLFLNAAAAMQTTLEPMELLRQLRKIEAKAGRVRFIRWGERTLDLDLLIFDDIIIERGKLILPHPRMGVRRFVLAPLEEVAAEARDPLGGLSIRELRENLDRRPSYLALRGWWTHPRRYRAYQRTVERLGGVGLSLREDLKLGDSFDPTLAARLDPYELLEKLASWLDCRCWSELGDQWLVTDFAIRELALGAAQYWPASDATKLQSFMTRLKERETSLIKPTIFVYKIRSSRGRPSMGYIGSWMNCFLLESRLTARHVSEVVTACAATRT